uniref:Immunoglobulin V-set domain-containing protein n=1 Tax=Neogobius melanostomus TaxID=47308 RepID=A0A8C6WT11_9GOBI
SFLGLSFQMRRYTGVKSETLTQPDSVTVQPGHTLSISCTVSYSSCTKHFSVRLLRSSRRRCHSVEIC